MQAAWTEFMVAFGRYGHIDTTSKNWFFRIIFGWGRPALMVGRIYRVESVDLSHDFCQIVLTSQTVRRNPLSGAMCYEHVADIYLPHYIAELNMSLLGSGRLRENWMTILPPEENKGRDKRYLLDGKWSIRLAHGFIEFPNI